MAGNARDRALQVICAQRWPRPRSTCTADAPSGIAVPPLARQKPRPTPCRGTSRRFTSSTTPDPGAENLRTSALCQSEAGRPDNRTATVRRMARAGTMGPQSAPPRLGRCGDWAPIPVARQAIRTSPGDRSMQHVGSRLGPDRGRFRRRVAGARVVEPAVRER